MTTASQNAMILRHLKRGRTLTTLEALRLFGCIRLPARVHDLKSDGHPITKTMVERNDKWVAQYRLKRAA